MDYKKSKQEIVDEVNKITGGNLYCAFDATSSNNSVMAAICAALPGVTKDKPCLYTTTNDWDPTPGSPVQSEVISLGQLGRDGAVKDLNNHLKKIIPVLYKLLKQETLKVSQYTVEGEGFEGILKAWDVQKSGVKGSTKVVAKVADE